MNCYNFLATYPDEAINKLRNIEPRRLCSPYTTVLRQSGHSFEISTVLCSLLLGAGYDAYVVSGYAIKDVTLKIMSRIDSPLLPVIEKEDKEISEKLHPKYKIKQTRDLRSKFLLTMEQRKIDESKAEKERLEKEENLKRLEEEKRPFDELEGKRVHSWILILAGQRGIENHFFIESSTGLSYSLESNLFCGIESVWNNHNYWVNKQDCSKGLNELDYDLTNVKKWEHLLIGEPFVRRRFKKKDLEEDDTNDMYDEKHLDMPPSWSLKISIPNDVLKRRFPGGAQKTFYKRTCVEQFAPYISDDGLISRITTYKDFDCTEIICVQEDYENRADKQVRRKHDVVQGVVTDYFNDGRDDCVTKYVYHDDNPGNKTIYYNSKLRFDGLLKIECTTTTMTQHYNNREDKLYYRQIFYGVADTKENGDDKGLQIIKKIIEKFERDDTKPHNQDIAHRIFSIAEGKIYLKYHYGKNNVTASSRIFIKPPISEMGEEMIFKPELTYGYQADIEEKPLSNLRLYILFEQQTKEEDNVINSIKEMETQVRDFVLQRAQEQAVCKLEVSLYNKEQNVDFRTSMLEKEEQQRLKKVKEIEHEIDFLAPYLARIENPNALSYEQALDVKYACLDEFKKLLLQRAISLQHSFENMGKELQERKNWYSVNHKGLSPEEEALYFEKINRDMFYMHTMEIRLTRQKELSPFRYEALVKYLNNHPKLQILVAPSL